MNEIKREDIEKITSESFGLWITSLWSSTDTIFGDLAHNDLRKVFLKLLEVLLEENKIKFCPPNELWSKGYDIWGAEPDFICKYIQDRWPRGIESSEDIQLTNFFYDVVPAILWIDDDGAIVAS